MSSIIALVFGLLFVPILLSLCRAFGLFVVVNEREAQVYTLFGKVVAIFDEPGLHIPLSTVGIRALLLPFFGKRYPVTTGLQQRYLRNQMVNSEEGTPMGVGVWYEMQITDPVAYLFSNANPEGSLQANVASATISTLSNLEMETMLEDRHSLSRSVRATVSPLSEKWGYQLGSVYIRKVAFTDAEMVHNITDKVVKRLVQVTSAMKQDGENRVGLIQSETAKKVSIKLAEAAATRPEVVGRVLNEINESDPEILQSVLDVLETEKLLESKASLELLPQGTSVIVSMGDSSQHSAPSSHGNLNWDVGQG